MSRDENVAVVESFLRCIVQKDLARLPVHSDYVAQSPLTPELRGAAAMDYLRAVSANVTAIEIKQHIVEGDWVATLFDEETTHGRLTVFSRFHVVAGRIKDARVFYDPRRIRRDRAALAWRQPPHGLDPPATAISHQRRQQSPRPP